MSQNAAATSAGQLVTLPYRIKQLHECATEARRYRIRLFGRQLWANLALAHLAVGRILRGAPVSVLGWPWAVALIGTVVVGALLVVTTPWPVALFFCVVVATILFSLMYFPSDSKVGETRATLRNELANLPLQRSAARQEHLQVLTELAKARKQHDTIGQPNRSGPSRVVLAAAGVLLVATIVSLTLWMTGFFSRYGQPTVGHAGQGQATTGNHSTAVSAPTGYVIHMRGESPTLTLDQYLDEVNVPLTWTKTKSLAHRFPTREEAERFVTQLRRMEAIAHLSGIYFVVESADTDDSRPSDSKVSDLEGWFCCCGVPLLVAALGIWIAIQRGKITQMCPACLKTISRFAKVCPHCGHPFR